MNIQDFNSRNRSEMVNNIMENKAIKEFNEIVDAANEAFPLFESVLDPIQKYRCPTLFGENNKEKSPKMKKEAREFLLNIAEKFIKDIDIPGAKIIEFFMIGSSLGYQYRSDADIDCDLRINVKKADMEGKFSMIPKGIIYPGSSQPVNIFLFCEEDPPYDFENHCENAYDLLENKWIKQGVLRNEYPIPYSYVAGVSEFIMDGIALQLQRADRHIQDVHKYISLDPERVEISAKERTDAIADGINDLKIDADALNLSHHFLFRFDGEGFSGEEFRISIDYKASRKHYTINNLIYKYVDGFGYYDKVNAKIKEIWTVIEKAENELEKSKGSADEERDQERVQKEVESLDEGLFSGHNKAKGKLLVLINNYEHYKSLFTKYNIQIRELKDIKKSLKNGSLISIAAASKTDYVIKYHIYNDDFSCELNDSTLKNIGFGLSEKELVNKANNSIPVDYKNKVSIYGDVPKQTVKYCINETSKEYNNLNDLLKDLKKLKEIEEYTIKKNRECEKYYKLLNDARRANKPDSEIFRLYKLAYHPDLTKKDIEINFEQISPISLKSEILKIFGPADRDQLLPDRLNQINNIKIVGKARYGDGAILSDEHPCLLLDNGKYFSLTEDDIYQFLSGSRAWGWYASRGETPPFKNLKEAESVESVNDKTTVLNNLRSDIQDEYTAIKGYDAHADFAEKNGCADIAKILRDIRDEEKVHIGELEAVMKKYDKEFKTSLYDGEKEAKEVLKECYLLESRLPEDGSDPQYGLPQQKKYPLFDKAHVEAAIKLFGHVDAEYEQQLARAIMAKMKKYDIPYSTVGEDNKLYKWIPEKYRKQEEGWNNYLKKYD